MQCDNNGLAMKFCRFGLKAGAAKYCGSNLGDANAGVYLARLDQIKKRLLKNMENQSTS